MSERSEDHPARDLRLHLWEPPESRPEVVAHFDPTHPSAHSLTTRRIVNASGDSLRPLVVIDPEDLAEVTRLTDWMQANGWTGLDHEAPLDMQAALRAFANPTPEPMPEPTDPAVRVVDGHAGETWARIDGYWVSVHYDERTWVDLVAERGPLRIVTPDAPTPDADRPLKAGDEARIAPGSIISGDDLRAQIVRLGVPAGFANGWWHVSNSNGRARVHITDLRRVRA